jgi:LysR family cys regulon transcriptional activator
MEPGVILSAADTDVIKIYVRLGIGGGIIVGMTYAPEVDNDLVMRDLSHLIFRSSIYTAFY